MSQPTNSLLQQAPASKLQAALLFSSSHHLSLAHCGDPQLDAEVVMVLVVIEFVVVLVVVVVVVVVIVVVVVVTVVELV